MTFVPFTDGAKVCIEMDLNLVDVSVCFHFKASSTPAESDFTSLGNLARTGWQNNLMPLLCDDLTFNNVRVYDMSAENAPAYDNATGLPVSGSVLTEALPGNVAVVVSYGTDNRGRSARGRSYIPGAPDNLAGTNIFDPTFVVNIALGINAFINAIESGTIWQFVVASKFADGLPRAEVFAQTVTTVSAKQSIGTRRKRLQPFF